MAYNYTINLKPYGDDPDLGVVGVDPATKYGYWEHKNGVEGGGLWFDEVGGKLELVDYDGYSGYLPVKVVRALRGAGFTVDSGFNPEA
jgi:hypothetical protein